MTLDKCYRTNPSRNCNERCKTHIHQLPLLIRHPDMSAPKARGHSHPWRINIKQIWGYSEVVNIAIYQWMFAGTTCKQRVSWRTQTVWLRSGRDQSQVSTDADSLFEGLIAHSPSTPLHTRWFGTALNVADPLRERANGGVVCRAWFGIGPYCQFHSVTAEADGNAFSCSCSLLVVLKYWASWHFDLIAAEEKVKEFLLREIL